MRRLGVALLVGIAGWLIGGSAAADAASLNRIGGNYDSPTYVTSDPASPDRLLITEQPGRIMVTTPAGTSLYLDLTDLVLDGGERGLWSMAFPPNFADSRLFYVAYSANDGALTLDEYREGPTPSATRASRRPVAAIPNDFGTSNHNGGQLQFGPDDLLYWSTGEDANQPNAQDLANNLGKVLRIDPRGSGTGQYTVPSDNPFVSTPGARPEVWAYGLRNPWRFSFDRENGALVIMDVGSGTWEEVDYASQASGGGKGINYGWPICEAFQGSDCNLMPLAAPIYAYESNGDDCAGMGGHVVRDPGISDLDGRYLFADLCGGMIRSIDPSSPPAVGADRSEALQVETPVSFGEDSCGRSYVVGQGGGGRVYRIQGETNGACPGQPALPDTDAPETSLQIKPKNKRRSRVVAKLSSTEPGSTFECKLDERDWKRCGDKRKLKGLSRGRHRFRARATDAAGNTDLSAAKDRFRTKE